MSTGHTPGPWWTELDKVFVGTPPDYELIADADPMNGGGVDGAEPYLSNARLIAAAPELLSACEAALEAMNAAGVLFPGDLHEGTEAKALLGAAIAKARGETA